MMKFLAAAPLLAVTALSFAATQDMKMDSMGKNMYGGPVYNGDPALDVTASLVQAGGGPDSFSTKTALVAMLGEDTVNAEAKKLTKKYGEMRVTRFFKVFDFAVTDALKIATNAGVTLPAASSTGKDLATTLVKAGEDEHGVFWTGYLLDKAVTHKIHMQVMMDIDKQFGADADKDYHRISNQAHYDIGKALAVDGVKLAPLH